MILVNMINKKKGMTPGGTSGAGFSR